MENFVYPNELRKLLQQEFKGVGILCTHDNKGKNGVLDKFLTAIYENKLNKFFVIVGCYYGLDVRNVLDCWVSSVYFPNGKITLEQAIEKRDAIISAYYSKNPKQNPEVRNIQINHPKLGKVVINSHVDEQTNDLIGTTTDCCFNLTPYYHADILENRDGTFRIKNLCVVKEEVVYVGLKRTSYGGTHDIKLITNKSTELGDIVVYPSSILSVTYANEK